MIVIPRVLTGLLRDGDPALQQRLALDFAVHVVEPAGQDHPGRRCLHAAYECLEGGVATARMIAARRDFFEHLYSYQEARDPVDTAVSIAITVACRRQLEEAGVVVRARFRPVADDVAKAAQAAAGAYAARGASGGDDVRAVVRAAKWEEARWQLTRLVELTPAPA